MEMTHEEESLNCKAKIRDFIEQDLEYRMIQLRTWSKWIDDLAYKAMLLSMLDSLKKRLERTEDSHERD